MVHTNAMWPAISSYYLEKVVQQHTTRVGVGLNVHFLSILTKWLAHIAAKHLNFG